MTRYRDESGDETVVVDFESIEHETDKAILLKHEQRHASEPVDLWWPKSQIRDLDETSKVLTVPRWLAEKKGVDHAD